MQILGTNLLDAAVVERHVTRFSTSRNHLLRGCYRFGLEFEPKSIRPREQIKIKWKSSPRVVCFRYSQLTASETIPGVNVGEGGQQPMIYDNPSIEIKRHNAQY